MDVHLSKSIAALVAAASGPASTQLSKPQYIAKGDALCGSASVQIRKLGPLSGRAAVAAYGNTWLQIDRRP